MASTSSRFSSSWAQRASLDTLAPVHFFRPLTALALGLACAACPTRPEDPGPPPPPPPTPSIVPGPAPDVVAEATCYGYVGRKLPDGGFSRGGKETLVVRRDGTADLHEGAAGGMVLAHGILATERIANLGALVALPAWAALVSKRGSPVPDGAMCEIVANHRSVTRFDMPDDEPLAKAVWAEVQTMWKTIDP